MTISITMAQKRKKSYKDQQSNLQIKLKIVMLVLITAIVLLAIDKFVEPEAVTLKATNPAEFKDSIADKVENYKSDLSYRETKRKHQLQGLVRQNDFDHIERGSVSVPESPDFDEITGEDLQEPGEDYQVDEYISESLINRQNLHALNKKQKLEYIEQFKANARSEGLDVEVDPVSLEVLNVRKIK